MKTIYWYYDIEYRIYLGSFLIYKGTLKPRAFATKQTDMDLKEDLEFDVPLADPRAKILFDYKESEIQLN